ncbi:hypothetical protein M5E87_25525 [Flavonifractor plautii]|nr:hypothetical protein M5E87_25525 [Flavonifractor plautii]
MQEPLAGGDALFLQRPWGDSGKTMELYFGRPIVWSHNGEVPEYLTLMGGLLVN